MKYKISNNYLFVAVFTAAVLLSLATCGKKPELKMIRFGGLTQGTTYQVTYYDSLERDFHHGVDSILQVIDFSMSVYNPASTISKVNRNESKGDDDLHFIKVFTQSQDISRQTGGAFDVTVGPLVKAWGFGLKHRDKVDQKMIDSLNKFIGYNKIRLDQNKVIKEDARIQLDFNAIAQGYTVDVIADYLESFHIHRYLIEIGGEVSGKGTKPDGTLWSVGIEKPQWGAIDQRPIQAILTLKNRAIATSGNYRKFFEENGVKYSHTIDPKTGYPARNRLLSVSVLADECSTADAYATAFMVMGLEKAKMILSAQPRLDAYFIYSDSVDVYKVDMTEGFRQSLQGEYYSN